MKREANITRQGQLGYTVVELLMALAIFAIGVTGILAMQYMASGANSHAKRLAVATQLAKSWQEKLAMDALLWGGPREWAIDNTRWLTQVTTQDNVWHLPINNATGDFGPAADANGEFVNYVTTPQTNVIFCTHIRLTRLLTTTNAQLLRSEVRVFWPKGSIGWNDGADYCTSAVVGAVGAATTQFNFVYQATAIRQTPNF